MKYLVFLIAILFTAESIARSEWVRYYKVSKGEFAREHVQSPTSAFFSIDINQRIIMLQINQSMPRCPAGLVCTQALPLPIVISLPIQIVKTDSCGSLTITAEEPWNNESPVHRRIELQDFSQSQCLSQKNLDSTAIYETQHLGRSGIESLAVSSMIVKPLEFTP
jgi:hypothetical protein